MAKQKKNTSESKQIVSNETPVVQTVPPTTTEVQPSSEDLEMKAIKKKYEIQKNLIERYREDQEKLRAERATFQTELESLKVLLEESEIVRVSTSKDCEHLKGEIALLKETSLFINHVKPILMTFNLESDIESLSHQNAATQFPVILEELKNRLSKLSNSKCELEVTNKELSSKSDELASHLEQLQKNMKNIQEEAEARINELAQVNEEKLNSDKVVREQVLSEANLVVENLKCELALLKEAHEAKEQLNISLTSAQEDAKRVTDDYKLVINSLESQIAALKSENEEHLQKIEQSANLTKSFMELNTSFAEKNEEVDKMSLLLSQKDAELSSISSVIEKLNLEIVELQTTSTNEIRKLNSVIDNFASSDAAHSAEKEQLKAQLENKIKFAEQERLALESQFQKLQSAYDNSVEELNKVGTKLSDHEKKLDEEYLKKKLLDDEVRALNNFINELKAMNTDLNDKVDFYNKIESKHANDISEYNSIIALIQEEKNKVEHEKNELCNLLQQAKLEKNQLSTLIENSSKVILEKENMILNLQNEYSELNNKHHIKSEEYNHVLSELQNELNEVRDSGSAKLANVIAEFNALQKEMTLFENDKSNLLKLIDQIKYEKETIQTKYNSLLKETKLEKTDRAELEAKVASLTEELKEEKKKESEEKSRADRLDRLFKMDKAKTEKDIDVLKAEIENYKYLEKEWIHEHKSVIEAKDLVEKKLAEITKKSVNIIDPVIHKKIENELNAANVLVNKLSAENKKLVQEKEKLNELKKQNEQKIKELDSKMNDIKINETKAEVIIPQQSSKAEKNKVIQQNIVNIFGYELNIFVVMVFVALVSLVVGKCA